MAEKPLVWKPHLGGEYRGDKGRKYWFKTRNGRVMSQPYAAGQMRWKWRDGVVDEWDVVAVARARD